MDDLSLKDLKLSNRDCARDPRGSSEDDRIGLLQPEEPASTADWRSLFSFTNRKHSATFAIALILSFAGGLIPPATSVLIGSIFSAFAKFASGSLSSSEFLQEVSASVAALVALGAGGWILNGAFFATWICFGEIQAKACREELFDGLLAKEQEWYDARKDGISALVSQCQTQVKALQNAVSEPLGYTIQAVVTTVASLVLAFYHSWSLTLVIMFTLPIGMLVLYILSSRMKPHIECQIEHLSELSRTTGRAIAAIETVKAFNGQEQECTLFTVALQKSALAYRAQANNNAFQIGFVTVLTLGMFVQGFWYGSQLLRGDGPLQAENIMTTFWSCLMATQAIQFVMPQMIVMEKGCVAGVTLKGLLAQVKRETREAKLDGGLMPQHCNGEIEFKNVSFSYPSRFGELALDDVSLLVPAKEMTYVVGRSGSGKSTIGNLILDIYKPLLGSIMIDGVQLELLNPTWIRDNISLLQQCSVLFNETVFQNIAFGKAGGFTTVSDHEIAEACATAYLDPVVQVLPLGLATKVGVGGNQLSGGQRQRVALARDWLRNANVLILDEAMSALDSITRAHVIDAIRRWRRGKTTMIITHDMNDIQPEDYMYVLEDGRVAQHGYRKNLETHSGSFYSFAHEHDDSKKISVGHSFTTTLPSYSLNMDAKGRRSSLVELPRSVYPLRLSNSEEITDKRRKGHLSVSTVKEERNYTIPEYIHKSLITSGFEPSKNQNLKLQTLEMQDVSPGLATPPWKVKAFFPTPPQKQKEVSVLQILSTLWPSLELSSRIKLIGGIAAAFTHAACTPIFSFALTHLLSSLLDARLPDVEPRRWSLAVLAIAVGDGVFSYLTHYLLESVGQSWVDYMRTRAFTKILLQPRSWFYEDRNGASHITEALEKNGEDMRNLVGRFAGNAFVGFVMILAGVVWSFTASWRLTLVGLSIAPIMYGITRGLTWVSDRYEAMCNDAAEATGAVFLETITNISTVRNFSLEGYFRQKYRASTEAALQVGVKRALFSGIGFGLSDSAILFATALIFYYGSLLVSTGLHKIDEVILVFTLLLFSLANANGVFSMIPQLSNSKDTARRLLRLSHLPLTSHELSGSSLITIPGSITFHDISFSYPSRPDILVLRNISFTINPGEFVAIVGHSGSGKSTLTTLLYRLNPATRGTLTIGEQPVQNYDVKELRKHIAVVAQNPQLFPCSIAENISYGMYPPPTLSTVQAAAEKAGIHEFISHLPLGYATMLGDNGTGLSGGQRQRVAIARALVRQPKVLVMDEGLSGLDPQGRADMRETLKGMKGEVTIVVVTHEIEMMMAAERVAVMKGGEMVEQGGFWELLEGRGELWRLVGGGV